VANARGYSAPHNFFIQNDQSQSLEGLTRVLRAIRGRDFNASVILIPADHCAAIESAWVFSARGALSLARDHLNTVYLLHDHLHPDSRAFNAAQDFCSSTVIVGTANSLLDLCEGNRSTKVLDLMTDDMNEPIISESDGAANAPRPPVNVVHVRLAEEYERIQSGRYTLPTSTHVDITA